MDELFTPEPKQPAVNPVFLVGIVVGVVAIGIAIYLLSFKPPMDQQVANILAGSLKPGDPGFDELNKDLVFWTDSNTVESPTGMGTISMFIKGHVRNKGTRNITILEVNVVVVDITENTVREKKVLVVPAQQPTLPAEDTVPLTVAIDGFSKKDDRANIRWRVTAVKAE